MPDFALAKIRTSPNWYVTWTSGGRSQRVSTGTSDRSQAEDFLAAFRLEASEKPLPDLSIAAALDWYWNTHAKNLFRPDSAELAIRYLKPFFGATPASSLNIAKQEAYVEHRRDLGAGNESIRRDLSVLAAALNRAVRYHKLDRPPPFLSLTPNHARERWLTRREVARLFHQMRQPVRGKAHSHVLLFTRLALYTGARTGAILDLTWDRVDFDRGLIDYRKPGRKETKKRRVVAPMTRKVRRMLKHAERHARGRHVISWAGERIDRVAKACIAHAEKAGIEGFSPHVLRHTFASWAVQKRVPIYTVGKALGQTVASTTERYAKLAPDDVREAMETAGKK